jgi:RimJ/RimL family protein N-acetyltransferase
MEELEPSQHERILPLVPAREDAGHMTFVHALIDGRMPGRILVDDRRVPRTALVLHASGFLFAIGEPDPVAVDAAVPELLAREAHLESPALWATSRLWENALDGLFELRTTRKEFAHAPSARPPPTRPLPPEHRVVPIDERIAARFGGLLDDWIVKAWGGARALAERSFGFAVRAGDDAMSFCAACAIGGGEAEIEIGTAPRLRRRGFATHAALAFIAECDRRGLVPAWTCAAANQASDRLARQLGFRPVRHVSGYPLRPDMERRNGRWCFPALQIRRRQRR